MLGFQSNRLYQLRSQYCDPSGRVYVTPYTFKIEENTLKEYSRMRSSFDDVSECFDAVQRGAQSRPRWEAP